MQTITTFETWRKVQAEHRNAEVGLVPTMGALHDGHLSLVRQSRTQNDITVVSIYINPTQFNDPKDLACYPSTLDEDFAMLEAAGVEYLFLPDRTTMYPDEYRYRMQETEMSKILCGASRPGHFEGVLTVVLKLLIGIAPTRAYFGEKDYQQYLLVDGMAKALHLPTRIMPCPIVREASGLAMSSRNRLLSPEGRQRAALFHRVLAGGASLAAMQRELEEQGFKLDYVQEHFGRIFGAVFLEQVRLIDNVPMLPAAQDDTRTEHPEPDCRTTVGELSPVTIEATTRHPLGGSAPQAHGALRPSQTNVLLHLSGSISCFKACALASMLVKDGYTVQATASAAALRFVGAASLEGITGRSVITDLFGNKPDPTPHITLAQKWAHLILAYPASANLLNRLASGLCDDLFGAICLANNFHVPLWLAPAMNSEMFAHPAVQGSIRQLTAWGARVLPTEEGRLACGTIGQGRLLAPERVVAMIKEVLG